MDKRTHVLALLVMIIWAGSVLGQDNYNTTQIFHWAAGHCENVAVNDNYVYFNDDSAVVIANISNPSSPEEVGRIMIPGGSIQQIVYSNSHLYVVDRNYLLRIINVTDPENPMEVFYGGSVLGISVAGSYAYVVADSLRIIDVSNPGNPVEVGSCGVSGGMPLQGSHSVTISGNYVYVGIGYIMDPHNGGFRIIDVSNPASPTEAGFYDAHEMFQDIVVHGNTAYLAGGGYWNNFQLHVIDVSDPQNPTAMTVYEDGGFGIDVSESFAYVVERSLRIIDVSDVLDPMETGFFDLPRTYDVAVRGSYAYVAAGDSGMYIIQNDLLVVANDAEPALPESFKLHQNYPNPFNPTTTIQYSLPEATSAKLRIFDILGQEITTLEQSEKPPGNYSVQWSGLNQSGTPVTTGVYLCRIVAGDFSQTIKMIYLK